jgi:glucose/arabinose dehydrogenase
VRRSLSLLVVLLATLAVAACASASGQRSGGLGPVLLLSGLDSPTQVTAPRGSRGVLYVVEQAGLVRVVRNGTLQERPFLDLRGRTRAGGEQGLLGLAFAPDYARSRQFVVDYTDRNGNTRIVRYRSNGSVAVPGSARQLLYVAQPYSNHNGGMVAYGKDGLLYIGMGDGGGAGDPGNRAQNPASRLGKILRLDPAHPGTKPATVALGVRNPWRFSFDRANGDLWIGDVGQDRIEEVDQVAWPLRGLLNLGWSVYEGRSPFKSEELGPGRLVAPVAQYTHADGCSITGGYVYRGSAVPSFAGRYIYGDYCSGKVWSLALVNGKAQQIRKEPFSIRTLTSFGEDGAGELYAVSGDGSLYRLTS